MNAYFRSGVSPLGITPLCHWVDWSSVHLTQRVVPLEALPTVPVRSAARPSEVVVPLSPASTRCTLCTVSAHPSFSGTWNLSLFQGNGTPAELRSVANQADGLTNL